MKEIFGIIAFLILFIQMIMSVVIYYTRIVPTLEKIGGWEYKRIISSRIWTLLIEYKKVCRENDLPVWYANIILTLFFDAPVLGILWMVLVG